MEEVVLGVDLGTSAVKALAVNRQGQVISQTSVTLPLIQLQSGFNEQDPKNWVESVKESIKLLIKQEAMYDKEIKGLSFSGQMHGLVALDKELKPLRNAILWNDTRTTKQCREIKEKYGEVLLGNPILEGFTLPKLLWMKENEPENWRRLEVFLLPKDYVRYELTGDVAMEYSDAAGTLLLNPDTQDWDKSMGEALELGNIFPRLVASHEFVGYLKSEIKKELNLDSDIAIFAGGSDNACGALGAGIINDAETLCSIGTSGVILTCTNHNDSASGHNIHFFNHVQPNMSYEMGVTLSAGASLNWLKHTFFKDETFENVVEQADQSQIGANGLLFAPYLQGERTPHGDAFIRGSFIGINNNTQKYDFVRAVIEGITYSLYESYKFMTQDGCHERQIVSIGGGAKSSFWLQLQADVFNANIMPLKYEEGPGMGAAMLAAYGMKWFNTMEDCADVFISYDETYKPNLENHKKYEQYFKIYQQIYQQTETLTQQLLNIN
ncbi:xylulokinase [Staphylococcus xylosus]|uniref:xylulokinase n=1 Tax=Staphylococcus xylosus TaxID=1288 RepID=UPI0018C471A5|nr:xylulokinase [Staphylococcus xylosus]MBG3874658.1 xylulokinase [Staphylococcus xylosus]UBV35110.1 xylulokinase [Staphylococcus xylosus]